MSYPQLAASDLFTEGWMKELQAAIRGRESELKKERPRCERMGLDNAVQDIDDSLKLLRGDGPKNPGMKAWLGVQDEKKKAPKKDPAQTELHEPERAGLALVSDDEAERSDAWDETPPDYRSWEHNASGVQSLVSTICSDETPAVAVRELTALEKGELERDPRPRNNVLTIIRDARSAMAQRVQSIAAAEGT